MRNPEQVLKVLDSKSNDINFKFDKLMKNFYNIEFYKLAYSNLYAKNKKQTESTDHLTDDLNLHHIENLIELIKTEAYQPQPLKSFSIPKKKSSDKRIIGKSNVYDQLVQQIMSMLLTAIYDNRFSKHAHGYRKGKSCHTALMEVKETFTGTKWWIKGDIKEFFDTMDHEIIITILRKRINDEKFLRLVRKFLNTGYLYERRVHKTYAGTPQGGIVSPILSNIYLNELDMKMYELMHSFNTVKKQRRATPTYKLMSERIANRRKILAVINEEERKDLEIECARLNDERESYRQSLPIGTIATQDTIYKRYSKYLEKVRRKLRVVNDDERKKIVKELKTLGLKQRELPAMDEFDPNFKRFRYVRYADDFLISIIGSKEDAENMRNEVTQFLLQLKLHLNEEKTDIIHNSKKVRFLGYDIFIAQRHANDRIKNVKVSGRYVNKRTLTGSVKLSLPYDKVKQFALDKQMIVITNDGRWKGKHRPQLLNNDALEIVRQYNSEFSGFYRYYQLAFDVKEKLGSFHQLFENSFKRTLAAKHKTKVSKLMNYEIELKNQKFKAYINQGNWGVRYVNKNGNVQFTEIFPFRNIQVVKELSNRNSNINIIDDRYTKTNFARTNMIDR